MGKGGISCRCRAGCPDRGKVAARKAADSLSLLFFCNRSHFKSRGGKLQRRIRLLEVGARAQSARNAPTLPPPPLTPPPAGAGGGVGGLGVRGRALRSLKYIQSINKMQTLWREGGERVGSVNAPESNTQAPDCTFSVSPVVSKQWHSS